MRSALRVAAMIAAALAAVIAGAHPANVASARIKVALDGTYELKVRFDVLAYCLDLPPDQIADGPMNELLDGSIADLQSSLDAARQRFGRKLIVIGDGARPADSIAFPSASDVEQLAAQTPQQRLPVMLAATLKGRLGPGAKAVSVRFPDSLGTVVLTVEFPYQEPISEPVESGSASTPIAIPTREAVAEVRAAVRAHAAPNPFAGSAAAASPLEPDRDPGPFLGARASAAGTSPWKPAETDTASPPAVVAHSSPPQRASVPARSWLANFAGFLKMGVRHIVPDGLDHILFVLGLFLLSTRTKDLLKQITAFTVAHSITLALSLYGVLRLPSSVVEPVIALSIVFVAVENLCTNKLHRWRAGVVFLFGLVHGLGFAAALKDLGLARGDYLTALVGFNTGVEVGQLCVVIAAFALVGWFRSHARYRDWVAVPASAVIAATALVWTVERLL